MNMSGVDIANEAGIFGYRPSVLANMLDDKEISYEVDVGDHKRTFGGCSSSELETALQLVNLLLATSLVPKEEDIKKVIQNFEESLSAKRRNPRTVFEKHVREIIHGNSC